jgi:hypothetical protein
MTTEYQRNGLKITVSDLLLSPTNLMAGRRRVYMVTSPFRVIVRGTGLYENIEVSSGFQTDLATIPLLAQVFIGARDNPGVLEASVIHDFACVNNWPREKANTMMYWMMLAFGVTRWRAAAIYLALMCFGYKSPLARLVRCFRQFFNMET